MALQFECKHCNKFIYTMNLEIGENAICKDCGKKTIIPKDAKIVSEYMVPEKDRENTENRDTKKNRDAKQNNNRKIIDKQQKDLFKKQERAISKVVLTTAPSIEGYKINKTLEIVTSECVFGMNIFRDMFASMTDFFGGRSEASQKVLKDAKKTCLQELKKEATLVGGNAVIAVDLDYSEMSGGGKSMLFLVASGTAVIIEPIESNK